MAGPPGVGKTTLAQPLAQRLGLTLVAKDAIKEALMDALGTPATVEESRALGRASVAVMQAIAATSAGAVIEAPFYPSAAEWIRSLPGAIVEVRCICDREVAAARYRGRAERHPGHLDGARTDDELWDERLLQPLGVGPVIEVNTTEQTDVESLANRIRALAAGSGA